MFDPSILSLKSNRFIITFENGVDLESEKQNLLSTLQSIKNPITFNYISAIACEIANQELDKLASINTVQKIYLDEKISLSEPNNEMVLTSEEIFQLNEAAVMINSRNVPYTGNGINISIIDTGIDFTHSDLAGKMLAQTSFVKTLYGFDADKTEDEKDYNGHGTHCAGIATGTGISSPSGYNNTGIAPGAKLLNAKCLDRFGSGFLSGVLAAIEWSINQGAAIISMSLGFNIPDPDHPVSRAVDNAVKQGIIVVTAAGNSGPLYTTIGSPASSRHTISVGASDKNDQITDFSSRGPTLLGFTDPDVIAPGRNIASPIAKGSLLEKIAQLSGFFVPGVNTNGYAVLSGTSMACPMVAGAAALLLEAFPGLNPYMIRAALMKGTDTLGYSPNIEGSGRLNVYKSYSLLLNSTPTFNISTVLPNNLPIPPFSNKFFPGSTHTDNVILISGSKNNMRVECHGNISNYLSLKNTTNNEIALNDTLLYILENESYYTILQTYIDFPLSIMPGIYTGQIKIFNNNTDQLIETVNLSYTVEIPRARIYFDTFHNYDFQDSFLSNYYNFTTHLNSLGIQVVFGSSLLSFPLLSQFDLLILPDIETPLTLNEQNAIKKYWEDANGGNILILSSFYPATAIESLNQLLTKLDIGVSYTKNNIESSYDIGLIKFSDEFTITDIKNHPITAGVSAFSWISGVEIGIQPAKGAFSVANYNNKPVIAVYNKSETQRLVCMGSERLFYDDLLNNFNNKKLVSQTIQWLLNDSRKSRQGDLRVQVFSNESILELGTENQTVVGFFVHDPLTNTPITNLIPNINLSSQIYYYNMGIWSLYLSINATMLTENGPGAYNFNISTNLIGLFKINITIDNLTSSKNGTGITYFNSTINIPKITNSSITTTQLYPQGSYGGTSSKIVYRNIDKVIINATVYHPNSNNQIKNITAYITSLESYSLDIKYLSIKMDNITSKNAVETDYSATILPDYTYPAGLYVIFIEIIDLNGNIDYKSAILEFNIINLYPVISQTNSKLNGMSFSTLQMGLPVNLIHGIGFNIEITGTDAESTIGQMSAYVAIFSIFTIGASAYLYELLWGTQIPFTGTLFAATLTLPANGISQIFDESYLLQGTFIILAILLDSDGEYDEDSYTYAMVTIQSQLIFIIIIVLIIVVIVFIVALLAILFLKKRTKKPIKIKRDLCPNCGANVFETQRYCGRCNYELALKNLRSDKLDFE